MPAERSPYAGRAITPLQLASAIPTALGLRQQGYGPLRAAIGGCSEAGIDPRAWAPVLQAFLNDSVSLAEAWSRDQHQFALDASAGGLNRAD